MGVGAFIFVFALWGLAAGAHFGMRWIAAREGIAAMSTPPEASRRIVRLVARRLVPGVSAGSLLLPVALGMSTSVVVTWAAVLVPAAYLLSIAVTAVIVLPAVSRRLADEERGIDRVMRRSQALIGEEMYEANADLLRQAIRLYPDSPAVCLRAAVSLLPDDVSDPVAGTESRYLAHRAAELAPNDGPHLFQVAHLMATLQEFEEARQLLDRARKRLPEDSPFRIDVLHLTGRLLASEGDDEGAEAALRAAFEQEPAEIGHGLWLADFLATRGRLVDGLRIASQALTHRPGDEQLIRVKDEILRCLERPVTTSDW